MRRILVTGSRDWTDEKVIFEALEAELRKGGDIMVVVHGGAKGADSIAAKWCRLWGNQIMEESHPAEWRAYGKAAGQIRNREMVDMGADVCLAFPTASSIGTRHCMSYAAKSGIPVVNLGE